MHSLTNRIPVKYVVVLTLIALLGLNSCAYYNTFYNAEEYYAEAQRLTRENQTEKVSKEEINLYSKAIEKSKKLLARYPDSKYTDDAQFIIAKSHFFKGDYLIAKRYFEDLLSQYSSSPHAGEVPLWVGRCLVKTGDLEMARYEASRVLKTDVKRSLQADALLLMGEIAVQQDSLDLAETYLERVIDRSPDGFTKAQAQFQVGKMRENKADYEGALKAYETVAKFRPSESLKVESIIRQTSMLKALNRDEDAVEMIQEMLQSDKFVEIRGKLEVELGKLFLVMGEVDAAQTKFTGIVEEYNRTDVAAEASYYLGEVYLTKLLDYNKAKTAFSNVKTQSPKSALVGKSAQRNKQIDRYMTIQFDHMNLERQLAGLSPITKTTKKSTTKGRKSRTGSRGRSRGGKARTAEQEAASRKFEGNKKVEITVVEVSAEDSTRFYQQIEENRYSLAEYMLFEFNRVDTTLTLLMEIENSSLDTNMQHQSAYMQYYALETISGDEAAGRRILDHIGVAYPHYYKTIMDRSAELVEVSEAGASRFESINALFESGDYDQASKGYLALREDSTVAATIRARSSFNHAWLHDHFLYNREQSVNSYNYFLDYFPEDPLVKTARNRLGLLAEEPATSNEKPESLDDVKPVVDEQDDRQVSKRPSDAEE